MWTCPNCGRTFQRTRQSHYCGKAPETVPAYIDAQQEAARPHLAALREIIQSSVPDARERIAWSMPYYEKGGNTLSFSACQRHVSFYAGAEAIAQFAPALDGFATQKSAIYLPYDRELPAELLGNIAKWCLG